MKVIVKIWGNALRVATFMLIAVAAACGPSRPAEPVNSSDFVAGVLEITNGYGGKLMILSNPKITTSLRNIVRVDSFYRERTPQYRSLLFSPLSTGTDTVGGDPAMIVDDFDRARLFSPNTKSVLEREDVVTIGVLSPAAARAKYGEHGRNGAIIMTTKQKEYPEEYPHLMSDPAVFQAAVWDTTRPMPGQVNIRFVVDTTGHVDPMSFVLICRQTPGAFVNPAQKNVILRSVWKPAQLHGRPVPWRLSYGLRTLVDSAKVVEDSASLCRY